MLWSTISGKEEDFHPISAGARNRIRVYIDGRLGYT